MNSGGGAQRAVVIAIAGDAQVAGGATDDSATVDHRHALVLIGGAHPIAATGFDGGLPGAGGLDGGILIDHEARKLHVRRRGLHVDAHVQVAVGHRERSIRVHSDLTIGQNPEAAAVGKCGVAGKRDTA